MNFDCIQFRERLVDALRGPLRAGEIERGAEEKRWVLAH